MLNVRKKEAPLSSVVLLKLYLYGYRYGIRTSRKLERRHKTNLEAIWLLRIASEIQNHRRFPEEPFQSLPRSFRRFVCLFKEWNLIEGETVAIDSFKIRGSNSLKNNFNEKKLLNHISYIDAQITEYEALLDAAIIRKINRNWRQN